MSHSLSSAFQGKYESEEEDWGRTSGPGSEPYYNIAYRAFVESFIRLNDIRTVVDIGCGDWQFSQFINWDKASYLGLDVVPSVVERNRARFASPTRSFDIMPDRHEDVPEADLLIVKDVLQHLPNAEIMLFMKHVFPRFRFCLLTNSIRKINTPVNIDVPAGGFRCLDLTLPPFNMTGANVLQFGTSAFEELRTVLVHR